MCLEITELRTLSAENMPASNAAIKIRSISKVQRSQRAVGYSLLSLSFPWILGETGKDSSGAK